MSTRKEILDVRGQVLRTFHYNEAEPDQFVIRTSENIDAVLEHVKRERDRATRYKDMRHIAEIPMTVVDRAMREGWFNDTARWKKFLNDPDNAALRVNGGRV